MQLEKACGPFKKVLDSQARMKKKVPKIKSGEKLSGDNRSVEANLVTRWYRVKDNIEVTRSCSIDWNSYFRESRVLV